MRRKWTDAELTKIQELYPDNATKDIADQLGKSVTAIYQAAYKFSLKKSETFIRSVSSGRIMKADHRGQMNWFKPGQKPWNKGMKGIHLGGVMTYFPPGHKPHNTKHDGYDSLRADGYIWTRLAEGRWVQKHRIIWEEANGKIPRGSCVIFRDGNPRNITLENMELITRRELMQRNTIQRYPVEVIGAIKALHKLNKVIRNAKQN